MATAAEMAQKASDAVADGQKAVHEAGGTKVVAGAAAVGAGVGNYSC